MLVDVPDEAGAQVCSPCRHSPRVRGPSLGIGAVIPSSRTRGRTGSSPHFGERAPGHIQPRPLGWTLGDQVMFELASAGDHVEGQGCGGFWGRRWGRNGE